jgi:hypothetical protein
LNLIGAYIAALPTEAEADRALKVWKSRFISQTYCGGGSSNHPDIRPAYIEAVKAAWVAAQPAEPQPQLIRDIIGGAVFIIALSLVCAFIATL